MKVLVTDGDNRAALAVTRSLGRAGHEVVVGATSDRCLAKASRYCRHAVTYPHPAAAPDAFVDWAVGAVGDLGIEAVVPISDITTFLITEHRTLLGPGCAVPFAEAAVVARAADKVGLMRTAERLGVPVPRSLIVTSADRLPDDGLEFPLVVKPWRSRIRTAAGWESTAVSHATNQDQLVRDLAARGAHEFPVMLQEKIVGPGMGVFACVHDGRPVALFSHRRLRERPPWGGVSVLAESAPVTSPAREYAIDLLREIGWQGVAMVEFKQDLRDGRPMLMEINGRFWGSLQLAVDAGVDFPAILLQTLEQRDLPASPPYALGVRTRWFWGDVDSLIQTLTGRGREMGWEEPRLRALVQFAKCWGRGLHYDNPKWHDPMPFVFESRERLRDAVRAAGLRGTGRGTPAPVSQLTAGGTDTALTIRTTGVLADVGLDEAGWNRLAASCDHHSVFQTHQWTRAWIAAYGDLYEPWFVVAHEGADVVGVAPLVIEHSVARGRVVRFLGEGRADYCGVMASAGRSDVVNTLLARVLADEGWEVLDLGNVLQHSPLLDLMRTACAKAKLALAVEDQFVCPTLLIEGHESEAARVFDKPSLRRRVAQFARRGPLEMRDLTTAADILPRLEPFFAQHIARWADTPSPSLFREARNTRFYRELTEALDQSGWLLFSSVEWDGRPLAFHFGFDYNGTILWYKPSFEITEAAHSPGLVMVHHLIGYAIQKQRRELDFTVGDEAFKRRFTNHVRHTVRLRVYRSPLASLGGRSLRSAASLARKLRGLAVPA